MKRALAIMAIGLLFVSGIAEAQGIGSHIRRSSDAPRNLRNNDPDSAERAANAFARCVADRRGTLARDVLALPYDGEDQRERSAQLIRGSERCMDNIGFQLRSDNATIVSGMAEHYVRAIFTDEQIAAVGELDEEQITATSLAPRNLAEFMGLCVARRAHRSVETLLSTEVTSDEELEALANVTPHLGPCLPEGQTIAFDRRSVRAITGVGLYRAALASADLDNAEASE